MYIAQRGDILLYEEPPNFSTYLIENGERREDPGEDRYFYHVAVARDANRKIEAQGKQVVIDQIDYDKVTPFRPPLTPAKIEDGLAAIDLCVGQPYDWWAIIDDGIRYWTRGRIHLPTKFIRSMERHRKICSSLVALYLRSAGMGQELPSIGVSPEDIYKAVKQWPVSGQSVG